VSSTPGIFNVLDYGAAGNGITDDTPSIQAAINAAFVANGGIVYLPKGTYLIDGGTIVRGSAPGDVSGAQCMGTAAMPPGVSWALESNLQTGYAGPNYPYSLNPTGGGTLPDGMLPNGPLLLFDNVTLLGDGPDLTILIAGENIYDGWIFNPAGQMYPPPPAHGSLVPLPQLGAIITTWNNWASWPLMSSSGPGYPDVDGYAAHNCYVKELSVDGQADQGVNAGKPLHLFDPTGVGSSDVINPEIVFAEGADTSIPWGTLYGAAVSLQMTLNCGVQRVRVINANVNGINLTGTQNVNAHANGPVPESFQQLTAPLTGNPDGLDVYVPPVVMASMSASNVPTINGFIRDCEVDLNFPFWVGGTRPESGHGRTGGSDGSLPIRAVGCASVVVAGNRVGIHNQPSNFAQFPPAAPYQNYPEVPPNTDDAMDCPGCWHMLIIDNIITNCGDGVGSEGNGVMTVARNIFHNFGSVGVDAPSNSGKTCSQTIIADNVFFLSADSGQPQMAINIDEQIPSSPGGLDPYRSGQNFGSGDVSQQATSQQGDLIICDNVFYGPGNNMMINLAAWGAIVKGNIFDFAAGGSVEPVYSHTPYNNPLEFVAVGSGTDGWPFPSCTGIAVKGNQIIISDNIFRNACPAGETNEDVIGISFPNSFPPPLQGVDTTRVIIKGNMFDGTIGVPIQDNSSGSDGLLGVRITDNIGVNPVGPLTVSLVGSSPPNGTVFANPYPYDCLVNVAAGMSTVTVHLYGVAFGAIATGQQRALLVKAGGTIELSWSGGAAPTWAWAGM
jgi:hypothetical protein